MEHSKPVKSKLLPANAYRKLNPGEVYDPVVGPDDLRPEVTMWSIGVGVAMVVVFTAAASYMALRAGNAIEASIPIAILAIFFGKLRVPRAPSWKTSWSRASARPRAWLRRVRLLSSRRSTSTSSISSGGRSFSPVSSAAPSAWC